MPGVNSVCVAARPGIIAADATLHGAQSNGANCSSSAEHRIVKVAGNESKIEQ